ncbi:MAG: hypothetical protein WC378_14860 [Opitutaceae bacterium]|jgi:hypothetical protein
MKEAGVVAKEQGLPGIAPLGVLFLRRHESLSFIKLVIGNERLSA